MLFGGARGLLVIDPDRFAPWTYKPPLVVSELRIDGEEGSAPLSVGGGGVASALWQVMPGN